MLLFILVMPACLLKKYLCSCLVKQHAEVVNEIENFHRNFIQPYEVIRLHYFAAIELSTNVDPASGQISEDERARGEEEEGGEGTDLVHGGQGHGRRFEGCCPRHAVRLLQVQSV